MPKIQILEHTTKYPLQMIGELSGICYGSNVLDKEKNIKRALDCIEHRHGRTLEFPDIYLEISDISAKTARELYTHIGGSPTRLQESTRYVDCMNFNYILPITIDTEDKKQIWEETIDKIRDSIKKLKNLDVPKEDYSNLLPLAYTTKIVWKINLRALANFFNQRLCEKAYWEIRELAWNLKFELESYSEEWNTISQILFVPKCKYYGKCYEKNGCFRHGEKK
jgi:thymidylate synthase (FAD)